MNEQTTRSDSEALATVTLEVPIKRGEQEIKQIRLRRPMGGELRGVSLSDLAQLDVGAIIKVAPRIAIPTLTTADMNSIDPADLMQIGSEILGFLLPKGVKASLEQ
jgi:hypothetical protein